MKSYNRILRAAYSLMWAIQPEKLEAILGFLELKAAGLAPKEDTLAEIQSASRLAAARATADATAGSGVVAVLPLFGLITHRGNMMGDISGPRGTSTDKFTSQFRQAVADPNVKAIVIDVDSPGGTVDGVTELFGEIYKARGKKSVTAVADCLMASAAYWIASAASEIVASPSAMVGSIGVYMAHEDESAANEAEGRKVTLISAGKYKTEGNAFEPLSDDAKAALQSSIDAFYNLFVKDVAKGRGVKANDVVNGFGEGRILDAQQAVTLGLVDRVATLDQVLAKYGVSRGNAGNAAAMRGTLPTVAGVLPSVEAKSADSGSDVDCTCPCDPCIAGDCETCNHDDCGCLGCTCEQASEQQASAQVRLALMRDQIRLASL